MGKSTNEIRKTKKWHFAHKKEDSCLAFYEAESMYHRHGKELLYKWFKRQNFHVDIEHYLPEIQQRPDIFIERAGRKVAIEYQCANLSIEQLYKRTYSYWRAGIQVIWIIGGNQLKKHSAYWVKFSSLMAFSLQSYPQPLLIFFCSKQKLFMKCAFLTSFSTSVSFSHIIYLPIETTPFEMLFSSVPFQKEILEREWKKRKDYFRKMLCLFGIIIINHYYASYITVNVPQQISLLKLVCRFRPHLLFKQIHLYGKLFYI